MGKSYTERPGQNKNYLQAWQMDVSAEHPLAVDPREFFEGVRPRIREKLTDLGTRWRQISACPEGVSS